MPEFVRAFLLPLPGWPRAIFSSDFEYAGAELRLNDSVVLSAATRAILEHGVRGVLPSSGSHVAMRLEALERHAVLLQVACAGKAGGAGADQRDLFVGGYGVVRRRHRVGGSLGSPGIAVAPASPTRGLRG